MRWLSSKFIPPPNEPVPLALIAPEAVICPLGPSATILPETCKFAVGLIPPKIEILSSLINNKGAVPIPPADGSIANGYKAVAEELLIKNESL